ncbi:MAG: hypothetical protein HQ453_08545 [Actinobacteria bacterium]|nr:hypothetical protein [Actinomycetota bacterium]
MQVAVQVRNNLNVPITFHVPRGSFAADDWLCGENPGLWDEAELQPGQTGEFTLVPNPITSVKATERHWSFPLNVLSGDTKVTSFKYAVEVVDQVGRQYIELADRSGYDCALENTWQFTYRGSPAQARINCQGALSMTFEYPITLIP